MDKLVGETDLTEAIIGCAIAVHRELGPGLLEATYEEALCIVERLDPVFDAQVLTYLKVTNVKVGLLINFNSRLLKSGIKRFVR